MKQEKASSHNVIRALVDVVAHTDIERPMPTQVKAAEILASRLDVARYKLHRADAPDTSIAAAHVVDATRDAAEVLRLVIASGELGMTGFEVAEAMGRDYNTVSGRFSGLADKGLIEDSGVRRKSPRGVAAIVWVRGAGQPKPKKASRKELIKLLRRVPDEGYALPSDLLDAIFDALDAEDA